MYRKKEYGDSKVEIVLLKSIANISTLKKSVSLLKV